MTSSETQATVAAARRLTRFLAEELTHPLPEALAAEYRQEIASLAAWVAVGESPATDAA